MRLPKHFFRLCAICLVLATPIVATVVLRVHDAGREIAAIGRERAGLRCGMIAGDLLAGVERFRLAVIWPSRQFPATPGGIRGPIDAALAQLAAPACAPLVEGPRTKLRVLHQAGRAMLEKTQLDAALASVPFGGAVLALFLDIEDASGLTYDPTVDAVNLVDALIARIPGLTERLDQSATIAEVAARRRRLARSDVVEVEKLSGRAHEIGAMANDDFEGALFALPALRPLLDGARTDAYRAQARLSKRIDADLADDDPPRDIAGMRALRLTSIAAGQRLLRAGDRVLETSFDARVAVLRRRVSNTIAIGGLALGAGCCAISLLWRALRRRDRIELERIHERAQNLETALARRSAERALRLTEAQFRAVFDYSHVGIAIIDGTGRRLEANAALRSMFGDALALVVTIANDMFGDVVRAKLDSHRAEHCFEIANGAQLWVELSLSIIGGSADEAIAAIVLAHDITEHKTANARLDHETLHDALTALPNRVYFVRRLDALLGTCGRRFAVVFLDLDRFKEVNDTLGHHAGDAVLRLAAQRLSAAVRPSDFVARLHGDEFAVLLGAIDADTNDEIVAIVARLRVALQISVETALHPIEISASIGYVRDGAGYRDSETLLHDADRAMYRSKAAGRNRVTAHEAAVRSAAANDA